MSQATADPSISLCTFTYNDGDFVRTLLDDVPGWSVQPDEIVVVDDGSEEPFACESGAAELRVIRLDPNRGITEAKRTGLSAARGDYILAMDCDVRVEADYFGRLLGHMARPPQKGGKGVGVVTGAVRHAAGDDLVSRYLHHFGDNHHVGVVGPVEFAPGNAYVLRRTAWEAVGGFGDYAETNCQDHVLSNRLRSAGWEIYADGRQVAAQTRSVTRTTLAKRVWKWCHKPVKEMLPNAARVFVPSVFEVMAKPMIDRLDRIAELGEPLFIYIELLYLLYTADDLAAFAEQRGTGPANARLELARTLHSRLAPWPRLRAMLRADLETLGAARADGAAPGPLWNDLFLFMDMLRDAKVLDWLNTDGVRLLQEDAARVQTHFSSYDRAVFRQPE